MEKFRSIFGSFLTGQTLNCIGIWLRTQTFTHGHVYVACSRFGKPENLAFALKRGSNGQAVDATNIVFKEILLDK